MKVETGRARMKKAPEGAFLEASLIGSDLNQNWNTRALILFAGSASGSGR